MQKDYIIYGDTDSLFINLEGFLFDQGIKKELWENLDDNKKISYIQKISRILENYVNEKSYRFTQKIDFNSQVENFRITFKQENIAKTALFVKKKKYATWIIREEGAPVDKIEVTGLEIVRSDSSEAVRTRLRGIMEMILKRTPEDEIISYISKCKKELRSVLPEEIAANIGIKNISKYVQEDNSWLKGAPWHVKGVANYRKLLKELSLERFYEDIYDGTKTRVVYVKKNPYNMETITFHRWPAQFDLVIQVDYDKMIEKFFVKKIKILLEPMGRVDLLEGETKQALMTFFG